MGGFSYGAASCLSRISISIEAIWSTVKPNIAPTVGLIVDLITPLPVVPSLMALLPALIRV